ncbi:hypothetical protein BD311DRAFT_792686 [Dichomitus squalens]|uniref:Uncharacterized protein n=1 Tax=Dichomitus squalens TaxID=114155 RepID=A0A4Q9M773_9APHY|nr:hypothetical protein BD311DRAFT_792686 [Dichomitus squalens]
MNPNTSYTVLEASLMLESNSGRLHWLLNKDVTAAQVKDCDSKEVQPEKPASSLLHIRPCPPKRRCQAQVRTDERLWKQTSLYEPILAELERGAEENNVRKPRAVACMHVVLENALIGHIKLRGKGH